MDGSTRLCDTILQVTLWERRDLKHKFSTEEIFSQIKNVSTKMVIYKTSVISM